MEDGTFNILQRYLELNINESADMFSTLRNPADYLLLHCSLDGWISAYLKKLY